MPLEIGRRQRSNIMKTRILTLLGICLLAFAGWVQPMHAAEKVKIASGGHLVHFAPLDLALAKGMFTAAGLEPEVVQLQSGTPVAQALISGQVDFAASNIIRTHVEAGTLRVLATTGDKRWFAFPDVPTLKELGYPAEYYAWSGFIAPAGTPRAVVGELEVESSRPSERNRRTFPLKFISSAKSFKFGDPYRSVESRASERSGPFGENKADSANQESGAQTSNRC